ncbi:MAG: beta-ketoacyl-ACP synthase III [Rickettsiales bacterium]|nr:beta-ketoacyl-ACP synthase III [Rickettsiales bacterium]
MKLIEIAFVGTGKFLPKKIISAKDLDQKFNKKIGWFEKKSGVKQRHFADADETTSQMAVNAAFDAIADAKINIKDLDCIISAATGVEQAIPNTSSLIQKKLGLENSAIATFDINSTCLSFFSALDVAAPMIEVGKYKNILIVSSEIPSLSLNWNDTETCSIFGDGAAAAIISKPQKNNQNHCQILASNFETYSRGFEFCQIKSGGTKLHPNQAPIDYAKYAFFEMNGKATYRIMTEIIDDFLARLFSKTNLKLSDIDLVIPHQASRMALNYLRKRLDVKSEKLIDIFATHGNQVAASIPSALHQAFKNNKIKKNDKILIIGTSAGISIAAMILQF